jgi:hypothetical protein
MAFKTQDGLDTISIEWLKKMQKECVHECDDRKQLETIFKCPQARTFYGQFAFAIPKTRFNLPPSLLRKNNLPRLRFRFDRLIGNQVPDLFLHSDFDAKKWIRITCMPDLCPPNITWHFLSGRHVKDFFMRTILFPSANLPYFLFHSIALNKCVLFDPPDHEFYLQYRSQSINGSGSLWLL